MAWLRVFERCLSLLSRLLSANHVWPMREATDAELFYAFMQMNLTSDTVLSAVLPTFVPARCVCGSDSVFGLTSTKKSFFLQSTKRRERKSSRQKSTFREAVERMFIYSIFCWQREKHTENTMWWWRHGGLLNIITHQGFPISTHKHQNGANFWRAL